MDYGLGLTLMLIGMVTVFAILLIVIYVSKGLIWIVNRCAPEAATTGKTAAATTATTTISPRVKAVITATINTLTNNTGRVTSIEKI